MPAKRRAHYTGSYDRLARLIRLAAAFNSETRCWRCGRTLDQHPPHRNGKPARWQAGHVIDGHPDGPLAPEASTCNSSAGATLGNIRREPRSENW